MGFWMPLKTEWAVLTTLASGLGPVFTTVHRVVVARLAEIEASSAADKLSQRAAEHALAIDEFISMFFADLHAFFFAGLALEFLLGGAVL